MSKSGSVGYHGRGKVSIDGRRHQVQVQAVEIGSKKDAGDTDVEGWAVPWRCSIYTHLEREAIDKALVACDKT